jgi:hypothetical protein
VITIIASFELIQSKPLPFFQGIPWKKFRFLGLDLDRVNIFQPFSFSSLQSLLHPPNFHIPSAQFIYQALPLPFIPFKTYIIILWT